MANLLTETAIKNKIQSKWCGQNYIYIEEIDSTNEILKHLVMTEEAGYLPAGTVVLTDFQSQGRGRLGRQWEAPPRSSLLFSILFRPFWPVEKCNWLTMLASNAVVQTITEQTELNAKIKWPNDIMIWVNGTWCKVAGLLLETDLDEDGRCRSAILGMGININIPAKDLPIGITPPASLLSASGAPVARQPFLLALLLKLETLYEAAAAGRSPQSEWQQNLMTIGQAVFVTDYDSEKRLKGTAVGTNEWGHLLVETADGRQYAIMAGDVTLRHKSFDNSGE